MENLYYYGYSYGYGGRLSTYFWVMLIVSIIQACIFGAITKSINEHKGRDGGFAWGFWLGGIGIIVVACRPAISYTPTESIIRPEHRIGSPYGSGSRYIDAPSNPASSNWRCSCGRYNAVYVSSCVCGQNKHQALTVKTTPAAPKPEQPVYVPRASGLNPAGSFTSANSEYANIAALKEYKALLDAGVISLVEFEAKKNEILSK